MRFRVRSPLPEILSEATRSPACSGCAERRLVKSPCRRREERFFFSSTRSLRGFFIGSIFQCCVTKTVSESYCVSMNARDLQTVFGCLNLSTSQYEGVRSKRRGQFLMRDAPDRGYQRESFLVCFDSRPARSRSERENISGFGSMAPPGPSIDPSCDGSYIIW